MEGDHPRNTLVVAALSALLLLAGCSKKEAKVTPPAQVPPPAPTASLAATPDSIQRGQSTELSWHTQNATDTTIAGLGYGTGVGLADGQPRGLDHLSA